MSFSKAFYEIFEKNFRALSEKFEDSIHEVAKAYEGFHMSNPFFTHFFGKQIKHEHDHVHGNEKKAESNSHIKKK